MVSGSIVPLRLATNAATLCGIYYSPDPAVAARGDMLVVPAFAEEMNRCRAMVAMQARAAARLGIGTLVLDPRGTGDSDGNFEDSSWELWRADLQAGIDWINAHANGCVALFGARLGALMTLDLAASNAGVKRVLLWQPVVDGKQYYTQFLRIKIAAELEDASGARSTEELRRQIAAGDSVEVSGFAMGRELSADIDRQNLQRVRRRADLQVAWYEVVPDADAAATPSVASTRALESCRRLCGEVLSWRVTGPPFWQVHERAVAPALIDATSAWLSSWPTVELLPAATTQAAESGVVELPREQTITFQCGGQTLVGALHLGDPSQRRGVVIVVAGGPQYRAGAHRQFVELARRLSAAGYPVLRFDLRGMGDSTGDYLGFEHSRPDLKAAVDALIAHVPQLDQVVLFGECESASGILFYVHRDPRVAGAVLVNPWVRTEEGRAAVMVKHYYAARLLQWAFWRKLLGGKLNFRQSIRNFAEQWALSRRSSAIQSGGDSGSDDGFDRLALPARTAVGMERFVGQALIIMSGKDYIAREFDEIVRSSPLWQKLMGVPRVRRIDMPDADHTFSKSGLKREVAMHVLTWLKAW